MVNARDTSVHTGADDELAAFPRDLFLYRKRRVAESVDKLLGRSFLPFADLAAINDDVMLACQTVDPNGAEGKMVEAHMHLPACCGHALFFEVMAEKVDELQEFCYQFSVFDMETYL